MPENQKTLSAHHLIGKKVRYRPEYEREPVSDVVISVEPLFSLRGSSKLELTLSNGAKVDAKRCYFSEPVSLTA